MAKKKKANVSPASSPFGSMGSAVGGFIQRLSKKKNSGPTPPAITNLKTIGGNRPDFRINSEDEWEQKEELSLPGDEDEEKDVAAMGMKSRSFEEIESTAALTHKQIMNDQLIAMIISMKKAGFNDEDLEETVQSGIRGYKVSKYKMEE